jgi:hypothetical protein
VVAAAAVDAKNAHTKQNCTIVRPAGSGSLIAHRIFPFFENVERNTGGRAARTSHHIHTETGHTWRAKSIEGVRFTRRFPVDLIRTCGATGFGEARYPVYTLFAILQPIALPSYVSAVCVVLSSCRPAVTLPRTSKRSP